MATWNLNQPTVVIPADQVVSPLDRAIRVGRAAHLGFGLIRPFLRDEKNDFANAGGEVQVRAAVGQILGTRAGSLTTEGELPWRTEFGSLLYLLKHQKNDAALQELARVYATEALRRWEPRVLLKEVLAERGSTTDGGENVLNVRVLYDIINANTPQNQVFVPNVVQDVQVV